MREQLALFSSEETTPTPPTQPARDFSTMSAIECFDLIAEAAGGTKRIRGLVLELAVRGLLTARVASDGTAQDLLKSLRQDVEGAGKTWSTPNSDQIAAEAGHAIPETWAWVQLEHLSVFGPRNGYSPKAIDRPTPTRTLALTATTSGRFDGRHFKYVDEQIPDGSHLWLEDGDLLIQRANTIEYVGVAAVYRGAPRAFIYPDLMMKVRMSSAVDVDYVHRVLSASPARNYLRARASGTAGTMPKISQGTVSSVPIPIPPIAEQKRIVAKVDQLMTLCDELEARQAKTREVGDRLTKAALGALTAAEGPEQVAAAWTTVAENLDALADQPSSVAELREAVLDLAVTGRLTYTSTQPKDAPQGEHYQPTFSVPERWTWSPLGALCQFIDYRGRTPTKTSSGVPLITAKNVRMGYLREEPREYIDEADFASWMTRGFPAYGDVLFTTEAPLGNVAQLLSKERVALAQRIITLHPFSHVSGAYLMVALMSPRVQEALRAQATGTTAQGIKASKLKLIPIPVPSEEEQHAIVAKVRQFMALCDDLEARLRARDEKAAKLAEALVAEALG